jgi:hypothetical protein
LFFTEKYVGNCAGTKVRQILVGFVVHHSFQRNVAIFYDDMDGRHGLKSVAREGGVAVDCAVNRTANLVIHRREWKNLDVVHHGGDSLDAFHGGLGVRLQCWSGHLAVKNYLVALDLIREIVENGIPRQHHQLVPHFFRQFFTILCFAALFLLFLRPSRG